MLIMRIIANDMDTERSNHFVSAIVAEIDGESALAVPQPTYSVQVSMLTGGTGDDPSTHVLVSLLGLQGGRAGVFEVDPIKPVTWGEVAQTLGLDFYGTQIWPVTALVRFALNRFTGSHADEIAYQIWEPPSPPYELGDSRAVWHAEVEHRAELQRAQMEEMHARAMQEANVADLVGQPVDTPSAQVVDPGGD